MAGIVDSLSPLLSTEKLISEIIGCRGSSFWERRDGRSRFPAFSTRLVRDFTFSVIQRGSLLSFSFITSLCASGFPLPTKALTESHPLYACIPKAALQTSGPTTLATLLMSTNFTRFFVPHLMNSDEPISSANANNIMNTSTSSGRIVTGVYPSCHVCDACRSKQPSVFSCFHVHVR